ncbi:MAG: pyridoxal-dependent decarboxylase, partial [Acidimicrobiales bacterium]
HVALGRRFRALKLWAVIRWYGGAGLRAHIRRGVSLAQEFAEWMRADDRFEIVAPHPFSTVCFRLRSSDDDNLELMERLTASGELYFTHTKVADRVVLRMAIGGLFTERRHVEEAWRLIRDAAPHSSAA